MKMKAFISIILIAFGYAIGYNVKEFNSTEQLKFIASNVGLYVQESQMTKAAADSYESGLRNVVIKAKGVTE